MNNNKHRQSIVIVACLVLMLFAVVGPTYAFFSVTAEVTEQSLYVENANPMGLIYDGSGVLSLENAIPGDRSQVKSFTVENPASGNVMQTYKLLLHIDENGFLVGNADHQLVLYVGYGDCNVNEDDSVPLSCDVMKEQDLTDGDEAYHEGIDIPLFEALIEPGEIQTFYTYIIFNDTGVSQDENKNASFSGHIALTDINLIKDDDLPYNDLSRFNKVKELIVDTHLDRVAQYFNSFASGNYYTNYYGDVDKYSFANLSINTDGAAIKERIDELRADLNMVDGESASFGFSFNNGNISFYLKDENFVNVFIRMDGKVLSFNYSGETSSLPRDAWTYGNPSHIATDSDIQNYNNSATFDRFSDMYYYFTPRLKTQTTIKKVLELIEFTFGAYFTVPDNLVIGDPV